MQLALDVARRGRRAGRVLAVRATDAQAQVQPIEQRWNRQAMANNHVQRVPVLVR